MAEASDVVFTIVGFPTDVRHVILGPDGVLQGSKGGNIIVDMTTSEPSLAVEIAEAAKKKNVYSVDAPVSGGDIGAREARSDPRGPRAGVVRREQAAVRQSSDS